MRAIARPANTSVPGDVLENFQASSGSVWLGANSFEERCLGSLLRLADCGAKVQRAIILHYPTKAYLEAEDMTRRRDHRNRIRDQTVRLGVSSIEDLDIQAYGAQQLLGVLQNLVANPRVKLLVVDITCLPKIHVVVLAAQLAADLRPDLHIIICYSSPESYGNLDQNAKENGWSDVIISPFSEQAIMQHELHSRGLVIAGHGSDRLWAALHELEPSGGTIVFGSVPRRPDITKLSEKLKLKLLRQLLIAGKDAWPQEVVDLADMGLIEAIAQKEIDDVRLFKAPVVLYPLGPKSLIVAAALHLARNHPRRSWFVYPVCSAYDVSHVPPAKLGA